MKWLYIHLPHGHPIILCVRGVEYPLGSMLLFDALCLCMHSSIFLPYVFVSLSPLNQENHYWHSLWLFADSRNVWMVDHKNQMTPL